MSSRVLNIIKEVIDQVLEENKAIFKVNGYDGKEFESPVYFNFTYSGLTGSKSDPNLATNIKKGERSYAEKNVDPSAKIANLYNDGAKQDNVRSLQKYIGLDKIDGSKLDIELDNPNASEEDIESSKASSAVVAKEPKDNLHALSTLPVYKIKDEDWKEYETKSATGNQYKKQPIKPMAGDDIAKQDQGLGKGYKDPDAPKRDSDYVSPNKDTRDRNTTTGKDPKDAKWVKKINEDDSDVTDDEKKALTGDRSVKLGIDKVPGDVDTDDLEKDDAAAEAGKEVKNKKHQYIKASSFKEYVKLYPELGNPNQKIVSKDATKMATDDLKFSGEEYYKILDPKRFAKVPNDYKLRPISDPFASGSEEAKLRRDLEGMTPEEKRAYMAKLKGKEYKAPDVKVKKPVNAKGPDFKTPIGKSGKPMVSKGERDVQVRESVLDIIKQVIKEETSK